MTEPITSKFAWIYITETVIFSLFVFISAIKYATTITKNFDVYNWGQIASASIYLVILFLVYFYVIIRNMVQITAAPEGLVLRYLITGKRIIIDYADITHVGNYRTNANFDNALIPSGLKLVIELTTGETLCFTDRQYTNYGELKDMIRRYRFHLN